MKTMTTEYTKNQKTTHLDFNHARTKEQVELMKKIDKDGVCPFCSEHFKKYHPKEILKENDWWFLSENMSPYEGTELHLIAVYKKHSTITTEIPSDHMAQMFDILNWAIKEYDIKGGSILIRFGDTAYTGGSVNHFHSHLIVGNAKGTDSNAQSLKKKMGYKKS